MPNPSATTNPLPQDTGFDPLEFWIRYKGKILLYGTLLLVALVVFGLFKWNEDRTKAASEAAFSSAKTAEDFRKVAEGYPRTVAGANAQMMLAERLRTDGKLDESIAASRAFIAQHADHPLIAIAWTSLASTLEAKADFDEALSAYQKVTTSYPNSAAAPVAFLGQARVLAAQGKAEDARRIYESVIAQFQNSPFAMRAQQQLQLLKKQLPAASTASSAPAETTPPAGEAPTASPASPPAPTTPAPASPPPVAPVSATPPPPAPAPATPAPTASADGAPATPSPSKKGASDKPKTPDGKKEKGKSNP